MKNRTVWTDHKMSLISIMITIEIYASTFASNIYEMIYTVSFKEMP